MIIGIGNDLTDIRRIEKLLENFGDKFENKIFTKTERDYANKKTTIINKAATYAKRFAAKEAFLKAIGSGMRDGLSWHDMEITNDKNGKPELSITGNTLKKLEYMTTKNTTINIFLSLSDEYPYAQAFVIIDSVNNK
ncbi:MAG: holo-ACP synthase [Rickettsiales bacterium]